jgi:hypothetical protein
MSLSFGGGKNKSKGTTSIDKSSMEYMEKVRNAAAGAGKAGPSPLVGGATDYYDTLMKGGNMGMGAMSGDPNAVSAMMNPYQQQVVDATNREWDNTDQRTMNAVNDRATAGGAFGGSRHGVATGVALGQNNQARMGQNASLLYGGFNDTMGRAGQMAQMGYAGAGQNANLGMGGVGNPDQWMMEMLKRGYMGPKGGATNGSGYGISGSASNAQMGG